MYQTIATHEYTLCGDAAGHTPMIDIPHAELVAVDSLSVDGQNPNRMTDKQLARLKASIERYGFIIPIITNKDLLVADGEQRLQIARQLGLDRVPVVKLQVTDVDRRLLRQVLNKLRGEHELLQDAHEFERIIQAGHEDDLKTLLDLSDSQLERYLAELHEPKAEDYDIPEIDKIQTDIKRGDIYSLGNHRLMCGDATTADVDKLMNPINAQMIFTDPPYNVGFTYHEYDDNQKPEQYFQMMEQAFKKMDAHLDPNSSVYCMSGDKFLDEILLGFRQFFRFSQMLLWLKTATLGNSDYQYNYEALLYGWKGKKHRFYGSNYELAATHFDKDIGKDKTIHGAQRPIALVARYIKNSSKPNDVVLDVFGGSGSTLIACEQTGRRCYMMEIDPRYCQVIINRWEAYTGHTAEKLN